LEDYLIKEHEVVERIIDENEHFVVLIPFLAVWLFETMIVPKRALRHIIEMTTDEKESFAKSLSVVTQVYDKVFNVPFPYSSGIHQAPVDSETHKGWH